jgi:hypothetical protein
MNIGIALEQPRLLVLCGNGKEHKSSCLLRRYGNDKEHKRYLVEKEKNIATQYFLNLVYDKTTCYILIIS